jgi:tetratricopeptide (TPR) repeat protein
MLYCCVLVIIACAAALRSIREQTIDERPAPWIFYAVLAAIGIFFLHNLVDFSMFEPGPLVLLMFFMGSAMGLRIGATAAGGEPGGRYPLRLILLALALTLWIGALAAIWAPTAIAEDLAADGRSALARQQPQAAANLFMKAADRQPLNADYPHFAATALAAAKSAMPAIESAIQRALAQNPLYLDPLHLRVRLYLERTPEDVERISATYSRILELNPNDLPTRIEFADYLWSHGRQDEALGHYQRAVSLNGQLDPTEPERLSDQDLERAQARIGGA